MAIFRIVPREGLEPSRISPYEPQSYMFTNYTTWAFENSNKKIHFCEMDFFIINFIRF